MIFSNFWTIGTGGYAEIRDTTIALNSAPQGGGIYNNAQLDLGNVTLAGNTNGIYNSGIGVIARMYNTVLDNPTFLNCDGDGTLPSSAGGNVSSDNSCSFSGPTDRNAIAPLLGDLANDGPGTTYYKPLLAGSPLINTAVLPCATVDQRHATRPDACDIGAVEAGGLIVGPLVHVYLPLTIR